jgi:flagellar biosynthetic protein FlhB
MPEELGERTEQPTGRRLSEARSEGQVAKSQDLASAIDMAGAVLLLAVFGGFGIAAMAGIMRRILDNQVPGNPFDPESVDATVMWTALQAAKILFPALLMMLVIGCLSHMVQVGWLYTTRPIRPNFARLNPAAGLRKFFNLRNTVKTAVNTLKLGVAGTIAYLVFRKHLPGIAALPSLGMTQGLYKTLLMGRDLALWLLAMFLVLGLTDYLYQRWQHTSDLRMTRQEVKDERRSVEGDPEVKSRRLRMAREIALQRIQQAVPKADVVVTNPTHFSVALQYDSATMHAPKVVAKGVDLLAFRIRHVAIASGVPMVERPPLARGLYWGVEVGQEIAPEFYEAVAEVLAYVYRLEGRAA